MKKSCRLTMSLALATACAIGANAQERSKATDRPASGAITVTGCVDRADEHAAAGTTGTTVDSLSFVLTHASRDGKAASSQPAPAATKEATAETGSTYRLDGALATLNPHVGHKVQVTGALEGSTAGTSGSADPGSAANAPRLKVQSVKMLAETCAR